MREVLGADEQDAQAVEQGVADGVTGRLGGMGGCAVIGRTMTNVEVPGPYRDVDFPAGASLLLLCPVFGPVVPHLPRAAPVAVMAMAPSAPSTGTRSAPTRSALTPPQLGSVAELLRHAQDLTHRMAPGRSGGPMPGA
ncbi:hypothetical protein [Kitasatospora sp. NPDC057198]|uniref:hypothetical protein n=1 Tax=Kitasatospora sp. NPDC057198 TaxID=3346046 RepID=UPI003631A792